VKRVREIPEGGGIAIALVLAAFFWVGFGLGALIF